MGKRTAGSYSIGLDIGVTGVGWSVAHSDGTLAKIKGKPAWGVRLFEEGSHAADRRMKRSARRRYVRRRHRLNMMQEMLSADMQKVDADFFRKMKESALWEEDRQIQNGLALLLKNVSVAGEPYHKKFPTIYHLRKYLLETKEQVDFRLVYLALHHTMKYRGNFLYEGQPLSAEGNLEEEVREATNAYLRFMMPSDDRDCTEEAVKTIKSAIADTALGRMDTRTAIRNVLAAQGCEEVSAAEYGKALAGSKFDATELFAFEGVEKIEIALSSEDLESDISSVPDEDAQVVLELMGRAYSASVLDEILGGCKGISRAMVKRYNEHAAQLRDFKDLVCEHAPDSYNEMLRQAGGNLKNYPNYITGENSTRKDSERKKYACSREDFLKSAKQLLISMPEEAHADTRHKRLLSAIDADTFLTKLRTRKNGAIPYQLHSQEMSKIIERQSVYYPALKAGYVDGEHKHRLVQILEFRIPYFVGPLSYNPDALESDRFDWLTRRVQGEKITPWNFNEVIDREQTAEDFITRMTGTCTYLLGEDVLPKHSILYQDFELLNELNKISIDGKPISVDVKKQAFNELFTSRKKVTHKAFADWLINENHHPEDTSIKITGTQKEAEFASSRSALIDMQKIFDGRAEENIGRCEDIILWATLFNEKDILKAKVEREYPEITKPQLKAIQKLRYKGWGRLSQKLLSGLRVQNRFDEKVSIIKIMRDTQMNFMEILNAKEYGFAGLIEQTNEENIGINPTLSPELLDDLVASPAVKRGIWQALLIVKELVQVMGAPPENIFIEMARGEQEKKRTVSRHNRLKELLKAVRSDSDYQDIIAEFDARKDNQKAFDNRALYLYFTQLGKCLYCGKDIHIDRLNRYQVDHIIPQSLTKDDSLENLALVHLECNQVKGDSLTINDDVRHSMDYFWRTLQGKRLIGSKKYNNLTRHEFSEHQIERFIARQLVETRQINKHVVEILHALHPESEVHGIKAGEVSDLRKRLELPKIRELNDTHHAMDAYLTALMGLFIQRRYPKWRSESNHGEYMKFAQNERKSCFGMFVNQFPKSHVNTETGEIIWDGELLEQTLRKLMEEKRYFFSRKTSVRGGAFYDETVYSPRAGIKALIPKKEGLAVERYGGYSREQKAYFVLIQYSEKSKTKVELVFVPVRVAICGKKRVHEYLEKNYQDCILLKDMVKPGQLIYYEGNLLYLVSEGQVANARPLFLPYGLQKDLKEILTADIKEDKDVASDEFNQKAVHICSEIAATIKHFYPIYVEIGERILGDIDGFKELSFADKQRFILELLKVTKTPSSAATFKRKVGDLPSFRNRAINEQKIDWDKAEFLDQSITGIFEQRYQVSE